MSDDDELEFEEYCEMPEAQLDAIFNRLMKEYGRRLDAMTPEQLYRYYRRTRLDLCLKQRKLIREFQMDFFQQKLKDTQRRLVEARIEYRTGMIAGHG